MGGVLGRAPRRGDTLGSPGSFDELHRACKEVFPQQMEGVKLIVTKMLSSHFQVTHSVHMSTLGPSGYRFNATFVGDRQLSPTEAFPTLVGDMDNSGSLNAQVLHLLGERIRTKAVFQTHQAKFVTWQFDGEYRGDDCTATLTLGNPDLLGESAILVAHFLQSVTSRLVLGGELVYHRRPGEEGAILTLAGKYTGRRAGARGAGGHRAAEPAAPSPPALLLSSSSQVGGDAQPGLRRRPRQLLPSRQRPGAGRGGAGGQHAAAGHDLRLWLPAQLAAGQHGLQRAPGQQLERRGGAGEEAAAPARHPGSGRLPQPLEEPFPLRLQRHRGLRARGGGRPVPPPCSGSRRAVPRQCRLGPAPAPRCRGSRRGGVCSPAAGGTPRDAAPRPSALSALAAAAAPGPPRPGAALPAAPAATVAPGARSHGAWKNKGALLCPVKLSGGRGAPVRAAGNPAPALADDFGEQRRHGGEVLDVQDLPRVLHLQRLQLRQQQQQLRVEEPGRGRDARLGSRGLSGGEGTVAAPGPWLLPALGHGVLVVDVALERQGHLLLELVDEIPLGDAAVVWGEEQHGLEQDVLGLVQPQLLQADVELEQRLQLITWKWYPVARSPQTAQTFSGGSPGSLGAAGARGLLSASEGLDADMAGARGQSLRDRALREPPRPQVPPRPPATLVRPPRRPVPVPGSGANGARCHRGAAWPGPGGVWTLNLSDGCGRRGGAGGEGTDGHGDRRTRGQAGGRRTRGQTDRRGDTPAPPPAPHWPPAPLKPGGPRGWGGGHRETPGQTDSGTDGQRRGHDREQPPRPPLSCRGRRRERRSQTRGPQEDAGGGGGDRHRPQRPRNRESRSRHPGKIPPLPEAKEGIGTLRGGPGTTPPGHGPSLNPPGQWGARISLAPSRTLRPPAGAGGVSVLAWGGSVFFWGGGHGQIPCPPAWRWLRGEGTVWGCPCPQDTPCFPTLGGDVGAVGGGSGAPRDRDKPLLFGGGTGVLPILIPPPLCHRPLLGGVLGAQHV